MIDGSIPGLFGWNVYEPAKLTKEQLLSVLHIDPERHRIVDTGGRSFLVDMEALTRFTVPGDGPVLTVTWPEKKLSE